MFYLIRFARAKGGKMFYSLKRFYSTFFKISFFFILFSIPLFSAANQILSGYVIDNTNRPLPYSIIQYSGKEGYTICDENGYFIVKEISRIDSIKVSRYGYKSKNISLSKLAKRQNIVVTLSPRDIKMSALEVAGQSSQPAHSSEIFSRLGYTQELNNLDNKEVLASLPGGYLRSYGGGAGTVTLSLNGAPSSHTQVKIEGFDINNIQNGNIDFSNIPTDFIQNMILLSSNSTDFRNSGTEGTILLSPWSGENSIAFERGSFGYTKYSITGNLPVNKFNLNLYAGREYSDGDFKYYNKTDQKEQKRKNNDFSQKYFSTKMDGMITDNLFAKSLFLYSEQDRGIAGATSYPTTEAIQDDKFLLWASQLGILHQKGYTTLKTIYKNSYSKYDQMPSDTAYSDHTLISGGISITNHYNFSPYFKTDVTVKYINDKLNSSEAGNHQRNSIISDFKATIDKVISMQPSIKWKFSPDKFNTFNPGLLLKYDFTKAAQINYLSLNYKKYFYYPTFNDLYWQPGGNPDLEPEKTNNYSLELGFKPSGNSLLKLNMFYKNSSDLIQWAPDPEDPGNWMGWFPQNIKDVERTGLTVSYDNYFSFIPLNMHFNYTYNNAENGLQNDKQLQYTPKNSANLILDFAPGNFILHGSVNYVGERITNYAGEFEPQDTKLAEMYDLSSKISYTIPLKYIDLKLSAGIKNILDKKLYTIADYPMPGRHYRFSVKISEFK